MTTRWWDPGSDVALLTPSGDPRIDLANGLTALHRAGAAAILDAAGTYPVLDDMILMQALADAREQFAPLLIEPVGKATSGPSYAGLLLRDVFDDAETAALQLFRTAIAKGMPRRMAAERVAKVYGVARIDMGRYARVATDPKSPPPVVTDIADETLFAAITRLVDAETAADEIAKAESSDRRRSAQAEQPRDAGGRYAVDGQNVEEWLASQLTGAHLTEAPPATPDVAPATPRRLHRTRKTRKLLREPAATRELTTRVNAVREHDRRPLSTRAQALRELAAATNSTRSTEVAVPDVSTLPRAGLPDDHLEQFDDPTDVVELHDDLAFAVAYNEAASFLRNAPRIQREDGRYVDTFKVTRAGVLQRFAGNPNREYPTADNKPDAHEQAVTGTAAKIAAGAVFEGQRAPETYHLSAGEMDKLMGNDTQRSRALLAELKDDMIRNWAKDNGVRVSVDHERGFVEMYTNYRNEEEFILVYTPPPEFGPDSRRPLVNVAEMHVPTGGMHGTHDRGSGTDPNETHSIAPNTPLRVKIPTDEHGMVLPFESLWDPDLGILRTQIYLRAGDGDDVNEARSVRKAMDREQFADAVAAGEIHRGETGQFTSSEDYLRSLGFTIAADEPPAAPRRVRGTRKLRRDTPGGQDTRQLSARALELREQTRRAQQLRAHTVRANEAVRARKAEPEFLPYDDYTVLSDAEMLKHLGIYPDAYSERRDGHFWAAALRRDSADWLINQGGARRDDTEVALMNRAAEDWHAQQIEHAPKMLEPMRLRDDSDWHALETRLMELFDEGVEGIGLQFHTSIENGDPVVAVRLQANARKLPPQNAIRWESGGPDDRDLEVVLEGETRGMSRETLSAMVRTYQHYDVASSGHWDNEDWLVNPQVRVWRVQRRAR